MIFYSVNKYLKIKKMLYYKNTIITKIQLHVTL